MTHSVETIEGIAPEEAGRLAGAGIRTTADLLRLCGESGGRARIGRSTGLGATRLLTLVNRAYLLHATGRIPDEPDPFVSTGAEPHEEPCLTRPDPVGSRVGSDNPNSEEE